MCTGLEIAAIASAVAATGGTLMQNSAMNDAQKAQANATMAELARQKKLRDEAERIFSASQKQAGPGEGAVDENIARQKREAVYSQSVAKPEDTGYAPAIQGSAPQVIKDEFARAGTAAANTGQREAKTRAAIDSFGDAQVLGDIFQGRQRIGLKNVGSFSQWSQDALDPELRAAAAKANSPLGDLLVGLGKAGLQFAGGPALEGLFAASPGAMTGNIIAPVTNGGLSTAGPFSKIVPFMGAL